MRPASRNENGPPLAVDPRGVQHAVHVVRRIANREQRRAGRGQFHEHGLHQILGFGPAPREGKAVSEQRRRVRVVEIREGVPVAPNQPAETPDVAMVITW